MAIYYAMFHAKPSPGSEQFSSYGGAYVCCWVHALGKSEALQLMLKAISGSSWNVVSQDEECHEVDELWYADNPKAKELFSQAVIDGECYEFNTYPIEPQDDDIVH